MFYKKILKVGDSLAVVIPSEVCNALEIRRGSFVCVTIDEKLQIILTKLSDKTAEQLEPPIINYE